MSHFTVLVRLRGALGEDDLDAAVAEALLPYKESGCGDRDPPGLRRFLEFVDDEDEHRKQYDEDKVEAFVDPSGNAHCKYDRRFQDPSQFGVISSGSRYICPQGWTEKEASAEEVYGCFEVFMKDHCGYAKRDREKGRYGHWRNPNQKWDWYQIGGRWAGRVLQGRDRCRVRDVDRTRLQVEAREKAETFYDDYQAMAAGREWPAFEGPREKALRIGFVTVVEQAKLTGTEWRTRKWGEKAWKPDNHDVFKDPGTKDAFLAEYAPAFSPLKTFAFLGPDGWGEPGEMGWFACSSDTPETYMAYARAFDDWVFTGDAGDWLVCVDCHI
jgi:hypothetical protein